MVLLFLSVTQIWSWPFNFHLFHQEEELNPADLILAKLPLKSVRVLWEYGPHDLSHSSCWLLGVWLLPPQVPQLLTESDIPTAHGWQHFPSVNWEHEKQCNAIVKNTLFTQWPSKKWTALGVLRLPLQNQQYRSTWEFKEPILNSCWKFKELFKQSENGSNYDC